MSLPTSASYVVVGGGIHGLSTAYHLAELLEEQGRPASDVVVLDKQRVGAGATGISGGIVRNFYLSPAINEIVRQSVEIFELDPGLFGFRQVGYVAVVPEAQAEELERIAEQHAAIGYPSSLARGPGPVAEHLRGIFPDWRAEGVTASLHEARSGWADAGTTVAALAGMTRSAGVRIVEGVEVTGFELTDGAVTGVETAAGPIACEAVVIAPGPWARDLWQMLALPDEIQVGEGLQPAFHYWQVREGEYGHVRETLDPQAPVVHLDADVPLVSLQDGSILQPAPWGIYFRPGLGGGIACGGLPLALETDCVLDPYGPSHPELGATSAAFDETMTTSLSWALGRFGDANAGWTSSSFAAPTCFTPDSYPIVGFVRENAYAVLDSNHGFKMLALGKLAAGELLGDEAPELAAFRLGRFAEAALHPVSASPYPWT
jgi:glycine/D-amino acid oxidase-like deaminating enzyme